MRVVLNIFVVLPLGRRKKLRTTRFLFILQKKRWKNDTGGNL